MQIMATEAARINGVKNKHLLSNVRTNGSIELEHRTDQDELRLIGRFGGLPANMSPEKR